MNSVTLTTTLNELKARGAGPTDQLIASGEQGVAVEDAGTANTEADQEKGREKGKEKMQAKGIGKDNGRVGVNAAHAPPPPRAVSHTRDSTVPMLPHPAAQVDKLAQRNGYLSIRQTFLQKVRCPSFPSTPPEGADRPCRQPARDAGLLVYCLVVTEFMVRMRQADGMRLGPSAHSAWP
jgi:hypothetical protein